MPATRCACADSLNVCLEVWWSGEHSRWEKHYFTLVDRPLVRNGCNKMSPSHLLDSVSLPFHSLLSTCTLLSEKKVSAVLLKHCLHWFESALSLGSVLMSVTHLCHLTEGPNTQWFLCVVYIDTLVGYGPVQCSVIWSASQQPNILSILLLAISSDEWSSNLNILSQYSQKAVF